MSCSNSLGEEAFSFLPGPFRVSGDKPGASKRKHVRMPSLKSMLLNDSFRFLMVFLGFHDKGIYRYSVVFYVHICLFNPMNPGSDQYLISPYNNTAESFIKVMRIRQMIINLRSFAFDY